jgi:hypothetical protein
VTEIQQYERPFINHCINPYITGLQTFSGFHQLYIQIIIIVIIILLLLLLLLLLGHAVA